MFWSCTQHSVPSGTGVAVASHVLPIRRKLLNLLVRITCQGEPVSSLYGCVQDGSLCSEHGLCNNGVCACSEGRTGKFCQLFINGTSSDNSLAIGLGNTTWSLYREVKLNIIIVASSNRIIYPFRFRVCSSCLLRCGSCVALSNIKEKRRLVSHVQFLRGGTFFILDPCIAYSNLS